VAFVDILNLGLASVEPPVIVAIQVIPDWCRPSRVCCDPLDNFVRGHLEQPGRVRVLSSLESRPSSRTKHLRQP